MSIMLLYIYSKNCLWNRVCPKIPPNICVEQLFPFNIELHKMIFSPKNNVILDT